MENSNPENVNTEDSTPVDASPSSTTFEVPDGITSDGNAQSFTTAASADDSESGDESTSEVSFSVGETVKISDDFAAYRGELGTITDLRMDPAGGGFPVADVELQRQTQVTDGSPIWFSNVPLSQLVKVQ
jgi:hypothetical protein